MSNQISFPAEWQQQSAVMLAWPHAGTDWQDDLEAVETVYSHLLAAICKYEKALLLCVDTQHQAAILARLNQHDVDTRQIIFHPLQYNDTWVRDYGPISIFSGSKPALLNFTFNGWGNKFDAALDNAVNRKLSDARVWPDIELHDVDVVLEGGSIDSDGQGTILTTSQCLLNPNRNRNFTRKQLECLLQEQLGCSRVLWLNHGYLAGDDTDSHIDTLARFCNPGTIVYMSCQDKNDEHYHSLKAMETELQQFITLSGKAYNLIPIDIPPAIFHPDGHRVPASYVNFLIINDAILLPVYQHPSADKMAREKLVVAFPQHEIIPVDCKPLIMQHGSLHCVTMQLQANIV